MLIFEEIILMKFNVNKIKILIFLFTISIGYSQNNQKGILFVNSNTMPTDKQYHMAAGGLIGFSSYQLFYKTQKNNRLKSIIFATLSATFIGTLKELSDTGQKGNKFDWADLAHTSAGGLFGAITVDLLMSAKNKPKLKRIRRY